MLLALLHLFIIGMNVFCSGSSSSASSTLTCRTPATTTTLETRRRRLPSTPMEEAILPQILVEGHSQVIMFLLVVAFAVYVCVVAVYVSAVYVCTAAVYVSIGLQSYVIVDTVYAYSILSMLLVMFNFITRSPHIVHAMIIVLIF